MIVYTAIFGGFDTLRPALDPKVAHYCFTDMEIECKGWDVRCVERKFKDPRKEARWYKTHSHVLFDVPVSVWVDGHILPQDVRFFRRFVRKKDIALHAHRRRDCLYAEAKFCQSVGKVSPKVAKAQMKRYKEEGYPEHNGLVETGCLVRKSTSQIARLNELWWEEIEKGSLRDQVSFNYVCWKLGIPYGVIPGKIYRNGRLTFDEHK